VTPSLSLWLELTARARPHRVKTALVAGPLLRHAAKEVHDLAVLYPQARTLDGAAATVAAVLEALDGAALAHIACHGHFRSDSPLFSSLELADGPLTALDVERLRRPPTVLVLSACDLALSVRQPGDELLGLSTTLLAGGTRTIVASVVPVPDAAARRVMVELHERLAAGMPPAVALAEAQASETTSAAAGFVCLGAD
jgi:CHAT domain-containing protein